MFLVKIWFLGDTDFAHYGPFKTYEEAQRWMDNQLHNMTPQAHGDVFKLIDPTT